MSRDTIKTSRTMVYLAAEQLKALRKKARIEWISVQVYARLIGLGSSGRSDIGDEHDDRLARALAHEHLR